ncbi:hypothetical protein BU24DRAFT_421234 [Aaosphaeria arxii CBS 175.79]|uniref:Uncharacterized protein n=1 Tax=Aaosphaeria arxii CBS 175.79 TaxID=1450172 RepID=A0A6A5XZS9_9PLEO|nr:uncharacterized protein BU24DRAFT_421234 [Aaosphaeria arxii CBS 175.79]KAF2018221.1 hypothetical protein BU24DRAFT_421234 [Aaosphaeria arxii CBS 175.79]
MHRHDDNISLFQQVIDHGLSEMQKQKPLSSIQHAHTHTNTFWHARKENPRPRDG